MAFSKEVRYVRVSPKKRVRALGKVDDYIAVVVGVVGFVEAGIMLTKLRLVLGARVEEAS